MPTRPLRAHVFALVLSATSALAADGSGPLIAEFPPDQEVCFGRTYDAAHFSRHPRQKVSALYLVRSLTADREEETKPLSRTETARQNVEWEATSRKERQAWPQMLPGTTHLDVLVKFRNRATTFKQKVECQKLEGQGFSCGVDCDGGGFGAQGDGRSLVLRQSEHSGGLRVQSGCSSGDESAPEVRIDPKDDALVFRLDPKPIAACHAVRDEARPAWVKGGGETLRERFAKAPGQCFVGRPSTGGGQKRLARVAVKTLERIRTDADDPQTPRLTVRLDVKLSDGKSVTRKLDCRGEDYSFNCSVEHGGFRLTRQGATGVTLRESYYQGGELARILGLPDSIKFDPIDMQPADAAKCGGSAG